MESSGHNNASLMMEYENKDELVRQMWERLGVGSDGFLTLEDLTKVCHAINMENNVNELFARLDLDGDGKISFAEFLHLFQKGFGEGSQSAPSTSQIGPSLTTIQSTPSLQNRSTSVNSVRTSSVTDEISSNNILPLLLPLESKEIPTNLPVWRVLQHWDQHGISEGVAILQELGLPCGQNDVIVLQDLISVVEEECTCYRKTGSGYTKQYLSQLLLQETKYLRSAVENALCERDKARSDLMLTSHRLSSQAQELDDHTLELEATAHQHIQSVEKQHQESMRSLHERLLAEMEGRETASAAVTELTKQTESLNEHILNLKSQLSESKGRCDKLQADNDEVTVKLEASEAALADSLALNSRLKDSEKELSTGSSESGRINMTEVEENEWQEVMRELGKLRQENQCLRDTNDEMVARIDQLTLHSTTTKMSQQTIDVSMDGSCIGDYLNNTSINQSLNNSLCTSAPQSSLKRATSEDRDVLHSPRDVSSADKRTSPDLLSPRAGKIARCCVTSPQTEYSSETYDANTICYNSQPASLELNLSSFRGEGYGMKNHRGSDRRVASASSVVTGLSMSSGSLSPSVSAPQSARRGGLWSKGSGLESELSCVRVEVDSLVQQRDQLASCVANLQIQYDNIVTQIGTWEQMIRTISSEVKADKGDSKANRRVSSDGGSPMSEDESPSEQSLPEESPRVKLVHTNLTPLLSALQGEVKERVRAVREKAMNELNESERERAKLMDSNTQLEGELQSAKSELDKSEEYWLMKLQEEQDYYEEERKVYDDNFAKLEAKISELETSPGKQRLSPIEESILFEEQVLALEKDISTLQHRLSESTSQKDEAIWQLNELKLKHETLLSSSDVKCEENAAPLSESSAPRDCTAAPLEGTAPDYEVMPVGVLNELLSSCRSQHQVKVEGLEAALEVAQQHLQHHTLHHIEQLRRAEKADSVLKELFTENAELMRVLQLTEERQKEAEAKLREQKMCHCATNLTA